MQGAISLRPYINTHRQPVSVIKTDVQSQIKARLLRPKSRKNISTTSTGKSKPQIGNVISQVESFIPLQFADAPLAGEEYMEVHNHLSTIEDPLWKHICQDVLEMMGPASTLRVWKSKLGQFSSQDKVVNITCETEETATFVQQYDFVILGSIQKYFPTLKQLKAKAAAGFIKNV